MSLEQCERLRDMPRSSIGFAEPLANAGERDMREHAARIEVERAAQRGLRDTELAELFMNERVQPVHRRITRVGRDGLAAQPFGMDELASVGERLRASEQAARVELARRERARRA